MPALPPPSCTTDVYLQAVIERIDALLALAVPAAPVPVKPAPRKPTQRSAHGQVGQ